MFLKIKWKISQLLSIDKSFCLINCSASWFFVQYRFISSENIPDAPSITPNSTRYNFTEGNDIELSCVTDGRPPSKVTWTKVGKSSNMVYPDGRTLVITNANRTEAGTYRCTATNGIGKGASAAIHVDIFCRYLIDILVEFKPNKYREWLSLIYLIQIQLFVIPDIHPFISQSKQPTPSMMSVCLSICLSVPVSVCLSDDKPTYANPFLLRFEFILY